MADTTNTAPVAPPDDPTPPPPDDPSSTPVKEVSLSDLQPTVGEMEETAADLKTQRDKLDKEYEAEKAQAAAASEQAVASKRAVADKMEQFAGEEKTAEEKAMQQWVDNTPQRQAYYATAMHAAPFLAIMTALGGKITKLNGQQMIAAQTGIVQGLNESSEEKFNAAMDQWKTSYQAMKDHLATLERYHTMMLNAYGNRSDADTLAADAAIRMAGDTRAASDKKLDQSISAYHWLLQARLGLGKVNNATMALNDKRKNESQGLPLGWTWKQIDFYAEMQRSGDTSFRTGLARMKDGSKIIAAIDRRAVDMSVARKESPQEVSARRDVRKGLSAALTDRTEGVAAAKQFVINFQKQADIVAKYTKRGVGGADPVINRWIQKGRKQVAGDGEVNAFDNAIRGLAREHMKIVNGATKSNAQLHVSAQETADELVNKDMNESMIRATLKEMRLEAKNAVDSGNEEIADLKYQITHIGTPEEGQEKPSTTAAVAGTQPAAAAGPQPKQIVSSGYSPSKRKWIIVYGDGTHGESDTDPKQQRAAPGSSTVH